MPRTPHLTTESLAGRSVVDRIVEVPGSTTAWVDERGSAATPEYTRQTQPVLTFRIPRGDGSSSIRYAGPFADGQVVADRFGDEAALAGLCAWLAGSAHPRLGHWRLVPAGVWPAASWVRADGHYVGLHRDVMAEDPAYDEALCGEDAEWPIFRSAQT